MIEWKELSSEDAEQIRLWRNQCLDTLRTPYPLTKEQQEDWYINTVCDRKANARWFGIHKTDNNVDNLIGYTGIENISFENRIGEISLLINPALQRKGYGEQAAALILKYAFEELNLNSVYGECYYSNAKAEQFWLKIIDQYEGFKTYLPSRKYIRGSYWCSLYFSIEKPV